MFPDDMVFIVRAEVNPIAQWMCHLDTLMRALEQGRYN